MLTHSVLQFSLAWPILARSNAPCALCFQFPLCFSSTTEELGLGDSCNMYEKYADCSERVIAVWNGRRRWADRLKYFRLRTEIKVWGLNCDFANSQSAYTSSAPLQLHIMEKPIAVFCPTKQSVSEGLPRHPLQNWKNTSLTYSFTM